MHLRPDSGNSFWMPGEGLTQGSSRFPPVSVDHGEVGSDPDSLAPDQPSNSALLDAIKGIQDGVKDQISALTNKLDTVSDQLQELDDRQKRLEEGMRASSSSASPRTPVPGKRIRRTPPALQVCTNFVLVFLQLTHHFTEQNTAYTFCI